MISWDFYFYAELLVSLIVPGGDPRGDAYTVEISFALTGSPEQVINEFEKRFISFNCIF